MAESQYQENLHFIMSHPEAVAREMTSIQGISEGRRQVAIEKADEARREWLRAEKAEAELTALRAEVERLTSLGKRWIQERSGERKERAALRAEVERLRAALEKIAIYLESGGVSNPFVQQMARAALAQEPPNDR